MSGDPRQPDEIDAAQTTQPAARLLDRIPEGVLYSSDTILDRFLAWVADIGLEPYAAQEEALLELMTNRHVVLSTPTGSGKSLVALGLHFKAICEGKRSFYTAPIKALVSEKFFALCEQFGPENVGMLTGDASINWGAPVICCTAEILANMALSQGIDTDAPYVVMDEFHYYDDHERGVAWQIPLVVLRHTQFLLMSATLGNTAIIEERIEERTGREIVHVHSDERPVPLDFSYTENPLHEVIADLLEAGKAPIYIVQFTQRDAADLAQSLTSARICNRDEKRAVAAAVGDFSFDTPYATDIRRFLNHGIGLHHAGVLPKDRLLMERLSQQGLLKVICGTDTLGVGVNIPIRSVLFTRLCKFDGEKVGILSVREFKQISGRAGRKGFDDFGSVVCQAPEHVVENKRLDSKAAAMPGGRKKKLVKKKPPAKGFVPWNEQTFEKLTSHLPEALRSRFELSHGLVINCLQSRAGSPESSEKGDPSYRVLVDLIEHCHEDRRRKRALLRQAAELFRSLRRAQIVELSRNVKGRGMRAHVSEDLQRNFSLHHTLSLYLVEAAEALDPDSPSFILDLLSLVEAILENPRPILIQQERRAKTELIAKLKAEGVPYEDRITQLESVTWPKPNAEFIYRTFELFAESHPWVGGENIRPKGIAREMYETFSSFGDYVKLGGLARIEGLLLRYLSQVHGTLARSVPEAVKSDEVRDMTGYFRSLVIDTDSSLLREWESLVSPLDPATTPVAAAEARGPEPRKPDLLANLQSFRARVRTEMHVLVRALAAGRYEEAAGRVRQHPEDPWDAARFEAALRPFFEEYEVLVFDPRARQAHLTLIKQREPRHFDVHQVLVDEAGDNLWNLEGEIDLEADAAPEGPLVQLRRIGC